MAGELIQPADPKVDTYLARMDFYEFIKIPKKYDWTRRPSVGRFQEVIEVDSEARIDKIVPGLSSILQEQCSLNDEDMRGVEYVLSEVIGNVFHHAESSVNAIVCAQHYPRKERIELAIVDCGKGFRATLEENPQWAGTIHTAQEAVKRALQCKVTGKPGNHTGEGLFFTRELIAENGGTLYVHSNDGWIRCRGRYEQGYTGLEWPGAIVAVSVKTTGSLKCKPIFDRYAPPEKDFVLLEGDDEIQF